MVSTNFGYLTTLPGICKLVSIVFVIFSISLGGHAYENSLYNVVYNFASKINGLDSIPDNIPGLGRERFFLAISGIILIYSTLSLFCCVINGQFPYDRTVKLADLVFHVLGAIFLITAGSLIIVSARKINNDICNREWSNPTSTPVTTTEMPITLSTVTVTGDYPTTSDKISTTTEEVTGSIVTTQSPPTTDVTTLSSSSTATETTTQSPTSTEAATESPTPTETTTESPTQTTTPSETTTEVSDTSTDSTSSPPPETPEPASEKTKNEDDEDEFNDLEFNSIALPQSQFKQLTLLNRKRLPAKRISLSAIQDEIFSNTKCQYRGEKDAAGSFAIIGSFIYGFIAVIQFLRLNTST